MPPTLFTTLFGERLGARKGDYVNIYLAGGVKGLTLFNFILGFFVICGVILLFEYVKYRYEGKE